MRNHLLNRFAAERALGERRTVGRATEFKLAFANFTRTAISELIFVDGHDRNEMKEETIKGKGERGRWGESAERSSAFLERFSSDEERRGGAFL